MVRPRGTIEVECQNSECAFYLKKEGKNIIKSGKYKSTGHQRYYCYHCKTYFMETKGTPLYRKHLSESEIINICKHLIEKNGIRSISRITGHHIGTICRLTSELAAHAEKANNYLLKDVGLSEFEVDEIWTFIKKNKRKLSKKAEHNLMMVMHGFTHA